MSKLHDFTQYFTTTLSKSGGLTAVETTGIVLQSISGVDDYTRPGVVCLTYANPLVQTTAEWITYTSIDNITKELQGVVRGAEGSSAKTHLNGCIIAFVLSKTQIKAMRDRLEGTSGSVVEDGTGLEILKKVGVASAVNEVTVTNAATGNAPEFSATGDDTNIDLKLKGKGTGLVKVYDGSSYVQVGASSNNLFAQAIINGNFDVWQRGTSTSTSGANGFAVFADRWYSQAYSGAGGAPGSNTFVVSRQAHTVGQTTVPSNPTYFHRYDLTVAGTEGTTSAYLRTWTRIEDVAKFSGGSFTLSFWAKANASRTIGATLRQNFGSGGSTSVDTSGGTFSLTTSWQKFTVTVTLPSVSGKTIGTSDFLELGIIYYKKDNADYALPSGTVGTWATGTFDLSEVQLCAGDVALPFMPKSYAQELADCRRYYFKPNFDDASTTYATLGVGQCTLATAALIHIPLPVKMRTIPTLENSAVSTLALEKADSSNQAVTVIAMAGSRPSTDYAVISVTVASGLVAGNITELVRNADASGYIALTAEL